MLSLAPSSSMSWRLGATLSPMSRVNMWLAAAASSMVKRRSILRRGGRCGGLGVGCELLCWFVGGWVGGLWVVLCKGCVRVVLC